MKELTEVMDAAEASCCTEGELVVAPRATAITAFDEETLATLAKALGHPTRVRILRLLAEQSSCMTGDIVAQLPLAQSTVSEHLRILREAGLIQGEIEGPRTSYCIDRTRVDLLKSIVTTL